MEDSYSECRIIEQKSLRLLHFQFTTPVGTLLPENIALIASFIRFNTTTYHSMGADLLQESTTILDEFYKKSTRPPKVSAGGLFSRKLTPPLIVNGIPLGDLILDDYAIRTPFCRQLNL